MRHHDYIVVGSGIAGLFVSLLAAERASVLLLTKARLADSNTSHAQGGIAAAVAENDSASLHAKDTVVAGGPLADPNAVDILTRLGATCIDDLVRLGVTFDRHDGQLELAREGAHSVSRVLHSGGDATGWNIEQALIRALAKNPNVTVREHAFVSDLVLEEDAGQMRVTGVEVIAADSGLPTTYQATNVVLATGGAGQVFFQTTNPVVATGDGVALAFRAGAAIADMEFMQFHPTALVLPGAPRFLISEAVRGEGAYLRRRDGYRFMLDHDPRAELASRDVVSRAIVREMADHGDTHVNLDLTHLPAELIRHRFPKIAAYCQALGLDITRDFIPVAPAAHYIMGGVRTDAWGRTSLPGLYAAGEVACTGVHGANRLASNSLLEGVAFGRRLVEATRRDTQPRAAELSAIVGPRDVVETYPLPVDSYISPARRDEFRQVMWNQVGLIREANGLQSALAWLDDTSRAESCAPVAVGLPTESAVAGLEFANMATVGRLMAIAALRRTESRGAHFRTDFPSENPTWQRRIVHFGEPAAANFRSATLCRVPAGAL
jgi:L-aspartate oxidase